MLPRLSLPVPVPRLFSSFIDFPLSLSRPCCAPSSLLRPLPRPSLSLVFAAALESCMSSPSSGFPLPLCLALPLSPLLLAAAATACRRPPSRALLPDIEASLSRSHASPHSRGELNALDIEGSMSKLVCSASLSRKVDADGLVHDRKRGGRGRRCSATRYNRTQEGGSRGYDTVAEEGEVDGESPGRQREGEKGRRRALGSEARLARAGRVPAGEVRGQHALPIMQRE